MALLTQYDMAIAGSDKLRILMRRPTDAAKAETEERDVFFQFPPKVVNDSRDGEWDEKPAGPNAGDKIAIYKCANPKKVTVEWKYIVGFASWTISDIKDELQLLRGYFRNPFIEGSGDSALSPLVVSLQLWKIGGDEPMSFRLQAINIKHGNTLIGKKPDGVFPLLTEVSAEFRSWPLIGKPPVQTVPGQKEFTVDWF